MGALGKEVRVLGRPAAIGRRSVIDRFLLVYMQNLTYRTTSGKYSQVHHGVPLEVGGGKGRKEGRRGLAASSSIIIPLCYCAVD